MLVWHFKNLRVPIWAHGPSFALHYLFDRARRGEMGYGCFANAHMIGLAGSNPALLQAMRASNWVFPDGKPVALLSRLCGARRARQVAGPEMMEQLMPLLARGSLPVYLFGSSEAVLSKLRQKLMLQHPGLVIAGAHSPPFRDWTIEEERADAVRIKESGARICFVALGCPKQELWMHRNAQHAACICLGVGAAFPMLAGLTPRAPKWVRTIGMEWIFRWLQEPRRLTRRYTVGNLMFLRATRRELLKSRV